MKDKFIKTLFETHQDSPKCPTIERVEAFTNQLLGILFPDLTDKPYSKAEELAFDLLNLKSELYEILFMYPNRESINADNKTSLFFDTLEDIYQVLNEGVKAMYESTLGGVGGRKDR